MAQKTFEDRRRYQKFYKDIVEDSILSKTRSNKNHWRMMARREAQRSRTNNFDYSQSRTSDGKSHSARYWQLRRAFGLSAG